jgi:monoamine oxidase
MGPQQEPAGIIFNQSQQPAGHVPAFFMPLTGIKIAITNYMEQQHDVIIIGAGAAGLISALEISLTGRSVAVIEASERCGGRINTNYTDNGYPVELGAEFVHGKLPITQELAKKAGLKMYEVGGSVWQKKDGEITRQKDFIEDFSVLEKKFNGIDHDLSVAGFMDKHLQGAAFEELRFSLQNYVEGYYAADMNKASTFALRDELTKADDEQYRLEKGYQYLIGYLEKECRKHGVQFYFSQPVKELSWKQNDVEAMTEKGSFKAKKVIVTASIGVLQKDRIGFSPTLPHLKETAQKLGYGHVIKINLWFEKAFWKNKEFTSKKNLKDLNFLFSEETVPTWWTQHPKDEPLLTGWLAGPKALTLQTLRDEELIKKALHSLSTIFNSGLIHLNQQLKKATVYNWSADPHFNGAYSYAVINGEEHMKEILRPVDNTVYFAGEGLHHGNEIGTVEAALQSGRNVSQQVVAAF